jgi:CHAT domain-containing protein
VLRLRVLDPLEPYLKGASVVLISPDGPLNYLPLGALPGRGAGHYWIEEQAIAVVPVPTMLAGRPGKINPTFLLAVGGVNYEANPGQEGRAEPGLQAAATSQEVLGGFPPLPATLAEVQDIGHLFTQLFPSAPPPMILKGTEAIKSRLRREAPRVRNLHLATHGFFAPRRLREDLGPRQPQRSELPSQDDRINLFGAVGVSEFIPDLLSGLALAGASIHSRSIGEDDGILTASEVAQLELGGNDLVVLSACETGLGELARGGGEGLLGLQRAFHVAGSRTVVASLWKVPDEATRELMARFYENMWEKKMPKLEALRQAQLSMMRQEVAGRPLGKGLVLRPTAKVRRVPSWVWAAWTLSGDWR